MSQGTRKASRSGILRQHSRPRALETAWRILREGHTHFPDNLTITDLGVDTREMKTLANTYTWVFGGLYSQPPKPRSRQVSPAAAG